MEMNRQKYAELHLHSQDQFDADNRPEEVCRRLKELGAEGFALTQHGTLAGIEPMRDAAKEYGLKFIPGVETYYGEDDDLQQNKHLILLSADYAGYRAIWKAVSDSQNSSGFSVMNEKILRDCFGEGSEGHGHVIATSACVNGVIAAVLRSNQVVQREIDKIRRKSEKYAVDEQVYSEMMTKISSCEEKLDQITREKDAAKTLSGARFAKRKKYVEKLLKTDDPLYALWS